MMKDLFVDNLITRNFNCSMTPCTCIDTVLTFFDRDSSQFCHEHVVLARGLQGKLGLPLSGNSSLSDCDAPPTAPPTTMHTSASEDMSASETSGIFDDIESHNANLRRSTRKKVQRVKDYGEDLVGLPSSSEGVTKQRKRRRTSTFQSRHFCRKRIRGNSFGGSTSRGSDIDSGGPRAKRVCQSMTWMPREREGEESLTVDLAPLELGAKFKSEMDILSREEHDVVS